MLKTDVMAVILSIVILCLYALLVLNFSREWLGAIVNKGALFKLLYTIALILPGLLLVALLSKERFVYFWDFSNYWVKAISFVELFFSEPFKAFETLYHSINHDEYSLLPNLLIAPANKLLGLNFGSYVFSIYLMYLIPLTLLISSLCIKVGEIENNKLKLALPLMCLIFTPLIIAMRAGMPDMVGLIIIFIVLKVLVGNDFLINKNYKAALAIGVLLTLLLFTRRWYIFWVVAYFPTLLIVNAIQSVVRKQRTIFLNTIMNLAISGVLLVSVVLVFFYPYFEMSILKDYKDIYSAYRDSVLQQLVGLPILYGTLTLILSGVGVFLLCRHSDISRKLISFLLISTILIFILFTRINAFAIHHSYLLTPFIVVSYMFGATLAKTKLKKPIFISSVAILVLNFMAVFMFPVLSVARLLSGIDAKPRARSDFSEVVRLSDDLLAIQDQGNLIYVLASSSVLNDDIIKNTKLPDLHAFPNVFVSQHVDKRDRFPGELFLANYVVVTDPALVHLREGDQHLISYLNNQILNGALHRHYETVHDYALGEGVSAYVKRRLSSPTHGEISEIRSFFEAKYPDYPDMYRIDEPLARISHALKGDGAGKLIFEGSNLIIHPGNLRPSEISFALDSTKSYIVSFATHFTDKEGVQQSRGPSFTGEVSLDVYLEEELHSQAYHTHEKDSVYHIPLNGVRSVSLRVGKGKDGELCDCFQLNDFQIVEN